MHFINQAMKNKFKDYTIKNLNDLRLNSICQYVVKWANAMEQEYLLSNQPLEEWFYDNARDFEYKMDTFGLTNNQAMVARNILEDVWIFGQWLNPAIDAKEQAMKEQRRKEREKYFKN